MISQEDKCPRCKVKTKYSKNTDIDLSTKWRQAIEKIGNVTEVKGVQGMISEYKIPEPLRQAHILAKKTINS